MGYTPPKKKRNWWEEAADDIGSFFGRAQKTVARAADSVIPGDQSSWHKEPTQQRQVTRTRPNEPIRITQPKPNVVATFSADKPQAIASLEQNQTKGIDINGTPEQGLQVRTALPDRKIVTVRPAGAQPDITVAKPTTQPQITVRKDPRMQSIDERLDQGKSWENISKETGIDLNTVKSRSQSTRPTYGMKTENFVSMKPDEVSTYKDAPQLLSSAWDKMNLSERNAYKAKLEELKLRGVGAAYNTYELLEKEGKFSAKNQAIDFAQQLGSGMQQAAGNVADVAIMGGQVVGEVGNAIDGTTRREEKQIADWQAEYDRQFSAVNKEIRNPATTPERKAELRAELSRLTSLERPKTSNERQMELTEQARNWVKNQKTITGESYNRYEDYTPTGDKWRDFSTVAGRGLSTGLDATMFLNPTSNLVKGTATKTTGQIVGNASRIAGTFGALETAAAGAESYGRTGDLKTAAQEGLTQGAIAAVTQGVLETGTGFIGNGRGGSPNVSRGTSSIVNDVIKESNPQVLKSIFGLPDNVAVELAQQTDEKVIEQTLRQIAIDPNLNISPEIRERLEREGITSVSVGDSPYRAHYDRNGNIVVRTPEDATDEILNQEVAHHVWLNRVSPEDKAAFVGHKGSGYQEAAGRRGYSEDDLMSEDFTVYTSMALRGQLDQVPESLRPIVAKYAGVVEQVKQATPTAPAAPVTTPRANVPIFSGRLDDLTKSKIDDLFSRSEATPRPPGTTRVFQDPGNGANGGTPWVFDNIDSLAAYRNNVTSQTDNYVFHDVPNGTLKPTGNGEHVYTMDVVPQVQTTVRNGNNLEVGTDARARFANRQLEQQTPAAEISAKYGGKVEDVQRNIDRYGEDVVRNMYASKSDSPTINNIDAVATAELRKQFGKARVVNAPQQAVPVEQATPNVAETINAPATVADAPVPVKAPEAATTRPIREALPTEAPLGRIAEDFYDSRTGNVKIKFNDIKAMADTVAARAYNDFRAIGSDLPSVAQITQKYVDDGITNLDEMVELTPAEREIWRSFRAEQDYIRRRSSLGNKEVSQGDQGEAYWSRISPDRQPTREQLFEGFRDKKPGSEFARKSDEFALKADEISYSPAVISKYIIEHADSKLLQEERIYRAMQRNNPELPEEQIRSAAQKVIDVQNRVNTVKTKINLAGVGKRVSVSKDGVVDFADEMKQVGEQLGKQQLPVTASPKGLTNGDRINSVDITYKGEVHTMGDFLGLNQFRDSGGYAGTQVTQVAGDRDSLAQLVGERLQGAYRIPADDVEYAVESVRRIGADVPEQVVTARVEAIYRNAAKQQLMEQLQNVNITNKTLRNDVSTLANQIVREGTIEQELSSKVVSKTLRATNALFRKLNVSSAINELSDLTSLASVYGKDLKVATPDFSLIKKYGVGEPDPALQSYIKAIDEGADVKSVLGKVNEATRLYKFVETYKAGVALKTAEDFYAARGLTGDELTAAVLKDFRELTLPVDAFTKTFLDDYPLWTQYLTWGARNMQKEGRLLTGSIDAGIMADKSNAQRIARNLYANIPAKTAFWLASNGLKGTSIMTAFGLTDFTGLTSQDYSGIAEEDKSFFDKTTQYTNISTVGSILNTVVQHFEKEQLKEKYANADYNPYENNNVADQLSRQFTPQFIKNAAGSYSFSKGEMVNGAADLMQNGYSENASGRIQYEAPTDPWNTFKAYAFGKNQTANAREYSGRENLKDRMDEGVNPLQAVKDMASEQLGLQDSDYNRPLTDDYSERYKAIDREARTALLEGGRQYNDYLDDLKKNEPDAYNNYIESMDGNHVNPEFWREVTADPKTFEMMRDRKKQLQKDLGTAYDPIYDLPDDQAAQVLKYKSSPTGDDIALRNVLNKEQWYKDYKARTSEFYDKNPAGGEGFKSTERVKEWEALDDKLSSYYFDKDAKEAPAWGKDFPLVLAQKQINATYGFDSPESKAFFKANYDGYAAQKEGYDKAQLDVINAMRKIEGYPPMSWEAYQQATEIADTDTSDDKDKNGWKNYGKGGGSYLDASGGSFGQAKGTSLDTIKVKVPTVSVKRKGGTPGKITVKKGGKLL